MSSKLREALEDARHLLMNIDFDEDSDLDDMAAPVVQKINEALAEPLKNCEVGTEAEQYRRFCLCCTNHKMPCQRSYTFGCAECYARWSQMPYESEGK